MRCGFTQNSNIYHLILPINVYLYKRLACLGGWHKFLLCSPFECVTYTDLYSSFCSTVQLAYVGKSVQETCTCLAILWLRDVCLIQVCSITKFVSLAVLFHLFYSCTYISAESKSKRGIMFIFPLQF